MRKHRDMKKVRKAILLSKLYRKKFLWFCINLLNSKMLCCLFEETIAVPKLSPLWIFMGKKEVSKKLRKSNSLWKLRKNPASLCLMLLLFRFNIAKLAELYMLRQLQFCTTCSKKSEAPKNPRNLVQVESLNTRKPHICYRLKFLDIASFLNKPNKL